MSEAGASTLGMPPMQRQHIEQLYTMIDAERARILCFLDDNSFLAPLLLDAHVQIQRYFPSSQLFLTVVTDPDMNSANADELVLSIATQLDTQDAMDRLDQIDDDWWLDALPQAMGKLCINLEFQ